ncbi:MAG: CZB domain-containing protein [Magnetococcales bacterium]|nr:CZB domain-containing protein [Magnetococcales bacterium]
MRRWFDMRAWGLRATMIAVVVSLTLSSMISGNMLIHALRTSVSGYEGILQVAGRMNDLAHIMNILMLQARRSEKDFLMRKDAKYIEQVGKVVTDLEKMAGEATELAGHPLIASQEDIEAARQIRELSMKYLAEFQELAKAILQNAPQEQTKPKADAMRATIHRIEPLLEAMRERSEKKTDTLKTEVGGKSGRLMQWALWLFGILTVLSLISAWYGLQRVMGQVGGEPSQVSGIVARIAAGDLNVVQNGDKSVGILAEVEQMAAGLREMVMHVRLQGGTTLPPVSEQIHQAVERMEAVSDQVSRITKATSAGNHRLAGLIREDVKTGAESIVSSMTNVGQLVDELRDAAGRVASSAALGSGNTSTLAAAAEEMSTNVAAVNRSLQEVSQMITRVAESMNRLTESQEDVRERCRTAESEAGRAIDRAHAGHVVMEKLTESAQQVGQIVQTINNIAEQTNMLALNASIEAAGAGESGKGFAVVANEVKALARQTAEATEDIGNRVREIQTHAVDAAEMVKEITKTIERLGVVNRDIAGAADEQAMASNEITQSMAGVEQASDVVTRSAQEVGLAVQEIARTASELGEGSHDLARTAERMNGAIGVTAQQAEQSNQLAHAMLRVMSDTLNASREMDGHMEEAVRAVHRLQSSNNTIGLLIEALGSVAHRLQEVQSRLKIGEPPFDMLKVKAAHLAWLQKLEDLLTGQSDMSEQEAVDDHSCQLGKWFFSPEGGGRFAALPSYREVDLVHRKVHELASQIIRDHKAGKDAVASMRHFNRLREDLFLQLDAFYIEAALGRGGNDGPMV